MKKVIFISSTGGHLVELLKLENIFSNYDFCVVTEKISTTDSIKKKYGKKVYRLIYGTKDHKLIYPFKLLVNCLFSLYIYIKERPEFIVTTGAHTAGPMCCIGKLFGSRIIFIESMANLATKTITGRLVYPISDLFIVQWNSMKKFYKRAVVCSSEDL